jgi:hypothetical protein
MPTTSPAKAVSAIWRCEAKKELRRRQAELLAGARQPRLHAALQLARTDACESDAVAVVRIHVRLDLEDEGRHLVLVGVDDARIRLLVARRGREIAKRVDEIADAEIPQCGAEEDRGQMAFKEGFPVEWTAGLAGEFQFLDEGFALVFRQVFGNRLRTVDRGRFDLGVAAAKRVVGKVVGAAEGLGAADRPGDRRGVERQLLLDLVENLEGIAAFAVHLVDEGDDRDVAHAAHLEQLQRARLDALGGVDDHHRGVDGGQRSVGVVGEVLVAGRVEDVEDIAVIFEGHHRGDDGNAALALDLHPVGPRMNAVLLRLDLAGELDRAAEQQQLFGERGLARVGVGDDRKCAAARDFAGKHGSHELCVLHENVGGI